MAIFNFGGAQVDGSDAEALAQAIQDAGGSVGGSIVAGNSYGVTGGVVTGDVHVGHETDES
ncbi:hypothetical protein XF35_23980 [Streptomyces platensis subsp. clarensis]|nr:hypothetical protein [Streptomyces platensis subsp. clarensis]